ncbi:MAG: hypothetical protein KIT84_11670 [Labilithrix sp.]|nr:hypothetical protein [Labilithrix sp.]MCW5811668.1 hypothetical protein [Labilithrix sp.]
MKRAASFVVAGVLCFATATVTPTAARADEPPPSEPPVKADNRARAQQLFDSALADAEAGDFAHACPKFLASQEADPKASTLLNLANCYEKNGQTASAWGAFREAEVLARKGQKSDWEATARARAEALEPKLLRLTIAVSDWAKVPGLVVTRDGAKLAPGEWGVAIPVDPGEHVVGAGADGYISIEKKLSVDEGDATFELPLLEKLPPPPEPPRPVTALPPGFGQLKKPPPAKWSPMEIAGVATSAAGAVGLTVGGLFALFAASTYNAATASCRVDGIRGCPRSSIEEADTAYGYATVSTVTMIAGGALLAGGLALVLFSPSDKKLARAPGVITW